jgi:tetratricopeptide (TPR) repeat protein
MLKNILLLTGIFLLSTSVYAQQGNKPPTQADMNKMMEEATKNMTPEQKEQMKKMMGGAMPAFDEKNKPAFYPEFTDNRQLMPKKDVARINAIPKKKLTQADIGAYAANLYNKIMTKGNAEEIALVKKLLTNCTSANDFGNAAIICMMQGHAQAAMAMSMKAVQAAPTNANWQNNMASLLTQYGYAEQAIPVLQKLNTEFIDNSTVLNNLAQAWLDLGVTDSAKVYSLAAIKSNPLNSDAQLCGGVLDEAEGNTTEAIEKYTQAMEQSPDPFTETLLKNSTGKSNLDKLDWGKIKNNITIYAYFPKDWIKVPELSDNVSGFETDAATQNGYATMFRLLEKEIQKILNIAQLQTNTSLKKSKEEFAQEIMKEGMKHGNSFISNPARILVTLITIKIQKLSQEFAQEKQKLDELIKKKRQEKINAGKNDDCAATDKRNNQFLSDVNPMLRKLFAKYIEEYRIWLNAYCTWTWYVTGNIKNTSTSLCLSFTQFYANLFKDAIAAQIKDAPCGKEGLRGDRESTAPLPKIPGFNCPTVVSMPVGMDWQALDNGIKSFDGNSLNINKSPGTPLPNMSIAYGLGGKMIAEPGKTPFTKVANGNILPEYGTEEYDGLAPIAPPKSERDYKAVVEKKSSELLKKTLQKMLNKMMLSNCDELEKMKESDKKKAWSEKVKKMEEFLRDYDETQRIKKEVEQIKKEIEENNSIKENIKKAVRNGEVDALEALDDMIANPKSSQLTPSLSSSVQAPNTIAPQPGLFK